MKQALSDLFINAAIRETVRGVIIQGELSEITDVDQERMCAITVVGFCGHAGNVDTLPGRYLYYPHSDQQI